MPCQTCGCASLQPVVKTPVVVVIGDGVGSMTSDCSVQVQLECLSDDKCEELRQLRAEVRMLRIKCQRTSGLYCQQKPHIILSLTGIVSLFLAADLACMAVTRAFYHASPTVCNSLPDELRNSDSFDGFKRFLKTIFFQPLLVWPAH